MATMDQNSNAVLQGIARHINCLGEDTKMTRRRALDGIKKDTINRKPPLEPSELKPVFNELLKPLLKVFSDPVERCRETSIEIIKDFLKVVPEADDSLPYVIPVIVQRVGQQEITEPSEELRLSLVELTNLTVELSGKKMSVYLDDLVKILQRTIVDQYPEVKKASCKCASNLAKSVPEYFIQYSEHLIKPLLTSISHQHSRVRAVVIETIGDVILYGHGKSVDTVVSHLAQRLFDQAPPVRAAVTKVVGTWLLELPDRYSFFHKLIPLLLTSVTDDLPEIRESADNFWYDAGLKYERENEEELKDKQDFAKPAPTHYPPNTERPNLGCRTLMYRNISKILPGLMKDVCDWVVETRVKSAALLYVLLLNAEDYVTQHMELTLSGMYRACADEDQRVVKDIERSAELIGYFVSPEVWCKLILTQIRTTQTYPGLIVLSAVVRGTERSQLKPFIQNICDAISNPDICQTVQGKMQLHILNCVESLFTAAKEDILECSQSLFNTLHTVLALQQGDIITEKVYALLDTLTKLHGFSSRSELYRAHTKPLLDSFEDSYRLWNTHSVERLVFDVLLIEAGPVVGELLDTTIPILTTNLNPEKDPEVRLKIFSLLSRLIMNAADTVDSKQLFQDFGVVVVKDMILPNCVWRAGKTAGAIRTTAVSCMWALLQSGVITREKLSPVAEDALTQFISSMDEDNKNTRLISCRVMTRILDLMGNSLDQDRLHNMYPELLKRLDDSSDDVRVMVTKTFLAYLGCFADGYNVDLYSAHLEAIYKGLLVHLDDSDEKIQISVLGQLGPALNEIAQILLKITLKQHQPESLALVTQFEVLKKAGGLKPTMLLPLVEVVKHKHRSQKYCQELMTYLLQINTA